MLVEATLLPCPLCGSPAFMDGKYWVCCNNGGCQTSTRPFETEAEAIAAWNLRAASKDAEPVAWTSPGNLDGLKDHDSFVIGSMCNRQGDGWTVPLFTHPSTGGEGGTHKLLNDIYDFLGGVDGAVELRARILTAIEPVAASPGVGDGQEQMVEAIVNGTDPMAKWMGSVDYSTYDGFEEYLKAQLRQKLDLKVRLDKKRHDSPEDESLATFVDGGAGVLQEALATYRVVRERVAAAPASPEPSPASEDGAREALEWYAEQVAGCRKLGSAGDPSRHALDRDGGKRATEALRALSSKQRSEKE